MVALMEWTDGISRSPDGRTCFLNQGCHHVFFSGPSQELTVSLTTMLTLELKKRIQVEFTVSLTTVVIMGICKVHVEDVALFIAAMMCFYRLQSKDIGEDHRI